MAAIAFKIFLTCVILFFVSSGFYGFYRDVIKMGLYRWIDIIFNLMAITSLCGMIVSLIAMIWGY